MHFPMGEVYILGGLLLAILDGHACFGCLSNWLVHAPSFDSIVMWTRKLMQEYLHGSVFRASDYRYLMVLNTLQEDVTPLSHHC